MITVFVGLLAIILVIVGVNNGDWGMVWFVVGVTVFLMFGASVERRDTKAWNNRQEYWSKSGPERVRMRRKWNEEARMQEEEERRRRAYNAQRSYKSAGQERMEAEEARRKREAYVAEVRARKTAGVGSDTTMGRMFQTNNPVQRMELFICPKCGREVRTVSKKMWYGDKVVREYVCPRCRMSIRTGI